MEHPSVSYNLKSETNDVDPIVDIIDYLVRCVNISFRNSTVDQPDVRNNDKIQYAFDLYKRSPTQFLLQFGKFLCANHLQYFEKSHICDEDFIRCLEELKCYHSSDSRNKRIRNRRFKALQKLQDDTDYFSEKQMMYRNPLLYEQLIGQYLTDNEIKQRDAIDKEGSLLGLILETVDRNEMIETKYQQMITENEEETEGFLQNNDKKNSASCENKQWGSFDVPDTKIPEKRMQSMINANERNLLREEFLQEMYCSFIEGRDINFDYNTVDNNEEYDDLQQISQDAEDKYFDSEDNDAKTLEEHMKLVEEYGRKKSIEIDSNTDPLDVYMQHISYKL